MTEQQTGQQQSDQAAAMAAMMQNLGIWNIARNDPNRLAVVDPDYREVRAGELVAEANRVSRGLRALGLRRGDGIAVVMGNEIPFVELYLAAQQIGLYFTAINFHLQGPEIAYIVDDSEAKAVFVGEPYVQQARRAGEEATGAQWFVSGEAEGFRPYAEVKQGQSAEPPEDRSPGQTMLYTSGTTGRPKGVRRALPEGDVDRAAAAGGMLALLFDIVPGPGAHLVAGPLYHAAPLAFGTGALNFGQSMVLMGKWTPEDTLERIQRYGISTSHMVPTMFHRLLALPDDVKKRYDVSSLKSVIHAAAPCPVDVKRGMLEWWGPVIYEYYAATEGGGTFVKPNDWLEHPGTVGQPFPGATIKIVDDQGNECPPNVPGTVYMGTPAALAPRFEYYKDDEKTKSAYRADGLFTVGDVGYLTEDGWLFLSDRKADMIISGGVNIYPAEVEAVLLTHPKVGDAAVFGIPNTDWGEEVKAVVEPAAGVRPSDDLAQELIDFCKDKLASYKCPRSLEFRDELPRQPTGKLYKRLLRDEYWQGRERNI